jgi:hypothetical protein
MNSTVTLTSIQAAESEGFADEVSPLPRLVLASTDPKRAAVDNALRQMHFEVQFFLLLLLFYVIVIRQS